jgi:hypothetical protein
MANTYIQIGSTYTVGSGGISSVSLTSIPATFTDLVVKISARTNRSSVTDGLGYYYNSDTTSARYTGKQLTSTGTAAQSTSYNPYNDENIYVSGNTATASTFSATELYIPNYAGSNQKTSSVDSTGENNAAPSFMNIGAALYNQTTAITSITFIPITGTLIMEYSTFTLYGIKNS